MEKVPPTLAPQTPLLPTPPPTHTPTPHFEVLGVREVKWGIVGTTEGCIDGARGICFTPSGNIVIAELRNCRVQEFTLQGVPVQIIDKYITHNDSAEKDKDNEVHHEHRLGPLMGVAVDKATGDIYIADQDNSIKVYSPGAKFDKNGNSNSAGKNNSEHVRIVPALKSISLSRRHLLLAVHVEVDATSDMVFILDGIIGRINIVDYHAPHALKLQFGPGLKSCAMTIDRTRHRVILATWEGHCVYVYSYAGNLIAQFAGPGNSPTQLHNPAGITVHPITGALIIADYNNRRLSTWQIDISEAANETYAFSHVIPLDDRPCRVSFNDTGNLLAISFENYVRILPYSIAHL